jgi:hypothetical protein
MCVRECVRSALIPSKRSFRALSCRCLRAGLESTNRFCGIVRLGMGSTTSSAIVGYCEETKRRKTRQRDDLHSHALDACPLALCFELPSMSSIAQLLEQAQASSSTNPKESERIYKQILSTASGEAQASAQDLREFLNCVCSIYIQRRTTTR